jgi:cytochrome c oxidase subunit 2
VIPILILVGIAVPSFRLLYFTDKNPDAEMTVKVIAHQWYWAYEYPDFKNAKGEAFTFESRIIAEKEIDPKKGQIRMLSVDNELILPVNTNIRVVMTSEDVMHGWAVPAFGMKRTVVPGRLNESWFNVEKIGLFYGQCSQICGNNHSYMPIAVRSVSKEDFKKWMDGKIKAAANDGPASGLAAVAPATR